MMDLQTALVGAGIFIISAVVLLFIALFGFKEKSYEEALAEQRQQTNSLLGVQSRTKSKEKKQKKTGKKVKEKQMGNKNEAEEEIDKSSVETNSDPVGGNENVKHHVEFKEPTVIEETVKENVSKKRLKRDKVRPILVNKDMSEETVVLDETRETPPANHFEQLHPKDEFELLQHLKEEQQQPPVVVVKEKINNKVNKQQNAEGRKKPPKEVAVAAPAVVVAAEVKQITVEVEPTTKNVVKKVSKQTQEIASSAATPPPVVVIEKDEVATAVVVPQTNGLITAAVVAKDKKKKKNELNALHQLTGDKQQGVNIALLTNLVGKAELSRSEIQTLIETLLNKQHEAPAVLEDWSEGKGDPQQKLKKQLAEKEKMLAEEQEALASAQAKLKVVRAEQVSERVQLQQRIRSLEEALQVKQLENQTVNNHLHSARQTLQQVQVQLNEEVMQNRKLVEEHNALQMQRQQFEHHLVQLQEAQNTIAQLQNDMQDLKAHNNQLAKELMNMNEQNERNQAAMVQCQHKLGHFTKEIDQKNEIVRQMEDAHGELEHRLSLYHKQENDFKAEIAQLKSTCQQQLEEVRHLELNNTQSLNEIRLFDGQKQNFEKVIFQLNSELKQLQDEKIQLETMIKNGSLEEDKSHKIEVMNLHNEISSVKMQLAQTEKKHTADLEATVNKFQVEIEELKHKNNVTIAKQQQTYKNLIHRLFPEIKIDGGISEDQWFSEVEKAVNTYIKDLRNYANDLETTNQADNSEITKLQAQILNYKSVIDDTEGMLNKLQAHIEQEERNWRKEIEAKEAEIEVLKQQQIKQLQVQVTTLEEQLHAEIEAKQKLTEECNLYKSRSKPQADTILQIEKLVEEVNRLSEELRIERTRNVELQTQIDEAVNASIKTQNHNSSNGPSISLENNGN